jgi:hypothetical protein
MRLAAILRRWSATEHLSNAPLPVHASSAFVDKNLRGELRKVDQWIHAWRVRSWADSEFAAGDREWWYWVGLGTICSAGPAERADLVWKGAVPGEVDASRAHGVPIPRRADSGGSQCSPETG